MPNVPGKMVSTATHGQVADAKQIWDEYYEGGKFQSAINSALKTASDEASTAANNAKTTAEGVSTRVATLEAVVAQINGTNSGSGQGNSGGSISALENRVSVLETNYNEHDGAINDHESNIEDLQYEVFGSEYVQGVSSVEHPGLINDVAALKSEIGISSGGSTTSLSARVGSLETSVASHTTSITNINGTLTEQASALSELASYKDDAVSAKNAAETAKNAAKSSEDAAKTYAEKCEDEVVKNASSSGASAASAKIDEALGDGGVIKDALDNATDNLIYISGIKDIPQFQSGAKYIANDLVFNTVNGEKAIYRVVESTNNAVWSSDESKYKKTNIVRELNNIRGTHEERLTVYVTNTGVDYSKLSLVVAYEGNVESYTFDSDGSSQTFIPSGIKYTMQVQVAEGGTTNLRNSPVYTYIAYNNTRDVNVTLASNQANVETITVNLSLSSPSGVLRATYLDLHITVTDLTDGNRSEQYSLEKNGSSNANGTVTFSVPLGHTYTISYSMDNVTSEEDGQTVTYSYSLPRTTQLVARVYQRTISYTVPQIENGLFECAYEYSVGDKKYLGLCEVDVLEQDNAGNPDAITYDMVKFIHINPKSLTDVKSSAAPTGDASFWLYVGEWRYTNVSVVTNGKVPYYGEAISSYGLASSGTPAQLAALKKTTGNASNDGFLTTQKMDLNAGDDNSNMPALSFIRNASYNLSYGNTSYNKTFFLSPYQMYIFKTLMASGKELYSLLQRIGRISGFNGSNTREVTTPPSAQAAGTRSYRVGADGSIWEYTYDANYPTCANYYNFKILSV